jgi:hypothetical protein
MERARLKKEEAAAQAAAASQNGTKPA